MNPEKEEAERISAMEVLSNELKRLAAARARVEKASPSGVLESKKLPAEKATSQMVDPSKESKKLVIEMYYAFLWCDVYALKLPHPWHIQAAADITLAGCYSLLPRWGWVHWAVPKVLLLVVGTEDQESLSHRSSVQSFCSSRSGGLRPAETSLENTDHLLSDMFC